MKLPQLPQDKANHVIYGMVICFIVSMALALIIPKIHASLVGLLVTMMAAGGKEYLDLRANQKAIAAGQSATHGVELGDFIATIAGGLVILLSRSVL
jgi:hypothetical protein